MTYSIRGLARERFAPLFGLDDAALAAAGARRVIADGHGFPCRVSLENAAPGETLVLLNHVSNDGDGPYRTAHAIFVREAASAAASYVGRTPPLFAGRMLSLRGFTAGGDLAEARLAAPGEHERIIGELFCNRQVDHIDAHNAAPGCFAARIERYRKEA